MSQIASTNAGSGSAAAAAPGGGMSLTLQSKVGEVLAVLGYLPSGIIGAMRVIMLDLAAHHRAKVGEHVGQDFPAGKRAQRYWFMRSGVYTAKADSIGQLEAGSFSKGTLHGGAKMWGVLETGGEVTASSPFAIPFGPRGMNFQGVRKMLATQRAATMDGVAGPISVVQTSAGAMLVQSMARTNKGGEMRKGSKSKLLANLRTRRHQPKLLRFVDSVNEVLPKHEKQMEQVFDLALTAIDRAKLAEKIERQAGLVVGYLQRGRPDRLKAWMPETNQMRSIRESAAAAATALRLAPSVEKGALA